MTKRGGAFERKTHLVQKAGVYAGLVLRGRGLYCILPAFEQSGVFPWAASAFLSTFCRRLRAASSSPISLTRWSNSSMSNCSRRRRARAGFAILLAYAVAILLLVLLGWLVVPQIVTASVCCSRTSPATYRACRKCCSMSRVSTGIDLQQATKMLDDSEAMVKEIYAMATNAMPQIVASIGSVASNFVAIFTSIAASIYMLAGQGSSAAPAAHAGARLPAGEGGLQHAAHLPLRQCKLYRAFLWARSSTPPSLVLSPLWP